MSEEFKSPIENSKFMALEIFKQYTDKKGNIVQFAVVRWFGGAPMLEKREFYGDPGSMKAGKAKALNRQDWDFIKTNINRINDVMVDVNNQPERKETRQDSGQAGFGGDDPGW